MILVSGASGKTGRQILRALSDLGLASRALVRNDVGAKAAIAAGASEHFLGDITDSTIWPSALAGIERVYLIVPNMHPHEFQIARALFQAAGAAKVQHIVYHSVLHPQTEAMPHHWQKLRVEEHLFTTGLPFTILQPTAYMQNLLASRERIVEEGVLANPYPPNSRISLVDLPDVATVAAEVLATDDHFGATYELVGTLPLSQDEVAATFAAVLKRPVEAQEIPLKEWQAAATDLPPYALDTLSRMFRYYAQYGLFGSNTVLTHLLGRRPSSLRQFAERELSSTE